MHVGIGLALGCHPIRPAIDHAVETIAHVHARVGLEAVLLDGLVHAKQHRHLDGAGGVKPARGVERPRRVVLEVIGGDRNG
jgi:hypothetical protein